MQHALIQIIINGRYTTLKVPYVLILLAQMHICR